MRRGYQQHCGLARALDLVGERWTLLVVRELLLGPRRFGQLLSGLPGISTNLLTSRLKTMVADGLIAKAEQGYRLTPRGERLETIIVEMGRWGWESMKEGPAPSDAVNAGWLMISLKRRYQGGLSHRFEVRIGERCFEVTLTPERMLVRESAAVGAAFVLEAQRITDLAEVFYGGLPWRERLSLSGSEAYWSEVADKFNIDS